MTLLKRTLSCLMALILIACQNTNQPFKVETFFIGTYTDKIYTLQFEKMKGSLTLIDSVKGIPNPSFLSLDSQNHFLYVVNENNTGSLSKWSASNNALKILDTQAIKGIHPCYVSLSHTKKYLGIANYTSGDIMIRNLQNHTDSIIVIPEKNTNKKNSHLVSHAHSLVFLPHNDTQFVTANLGLDRLTFYTIVYRNKLNKTMINQEILLPKGSGPRHLIFSPIDKNRLYVINELGGYVSFLSKNNNQWQIVQNIPSDTTIRQKEDVSGSADIHITTDGKFLYTSNRLTSNSISVFSIDPKGLLKFIQQIRTPKHPRNFLITTNQQYIFVASRDENSVSVYKRNMQNGLLTETPISQINIPKPVCIATAYQRLVSQ